MVRHQLGDPVGGNVAGCTSTRPCEARVGGQLADPAAGIPPHLAGDGEAQVGHVAQGVDEQVDALVVAHDAEREQPRRAVRARGAAAGRAAGQVRRQVELAHVRGAELGGEAGLLVGVDDDGVDAAQERLHQLSVAGVALVRQHVVRDEHGARPVPVVAVARPTPAARSRARWAGTTAGMTCTTTMTSTSRSRRPARTQVSGRAQDSTRRVRGKGSTSAEPPGTDCSPG